MFDDCKTLKDIPTFQKDLITEFNTRNVIKFFRTKDIPKQGNKPNVNNSDVTEKKNEPVLVKEEFKKKKIDLIKDLETAKENPRNNSHSQREKLENLRRMCIFKLSTNAKSVQNSQNTEKISR